MDLFDGDAFMRVREANTRRRRMRRRNAGRV
jgi:hypothetical protein